MTQVRKIQTQKLILENKQGHKVRTFCWDQHRDQSVLFLVYSNSTKRVEAHTNLSDLDDSGVDYTLLKEVKFSDLGSNGVLVPRIGRLRFQTDHDILNPEAVLSDEDKKEVISSFKKSIYAHGAVFLLLLVMTFIFGREQAVVEEPKLVEIPVPKKEEMVPPKSVAVSETRIVPKKIPPKARVVSHPVPPPKVVTHKAKVKPTKVSKVSKPQNQHTVYSHIAKETVENIGALAALGGLKNGTKGYSGLDLNSMKNIRGAGVGSGGGGVGSGIGGGIRSVLPGQGLIAGSAGHGGRAESAGGYGTKGVGGGKAGYGKVNLVGSTSGITLPVDEEAVIQGGLDRDQIAAVINKHMGQIVYCYEQGLQAKPNLMGRVSIKFVINPRGGVSMAGVANSSLHDSRVESCVVGKMRGWKFPQPVGNVSVNVLYPFDLRRVTQN